MVRSPGQVTTLLAARADFVGKGGVPALNGAASRANTETVRADVIQTSQVVGWVWVWDDIIL